MCSSDLPDGHGVILCRMLHGLPQLVLHLLWQALYVANDTEPHIILHKDLVLKRSKDKSHECCHLVSRTVPVLGREFHHTQLMLHIHTLALLQTDIVDIGDTWTYRQIDVQIEFLAYDGVGSDSNL